MRARSLLPGLFLLGVFSAAAAEPRVEIIDRGRYETAARTTVPMPISVSGKMNLVERVRLVEATQEIVGQIGNSFGFRYRILGIGEGEQVLVRTRHPMLTNPETGRSMDYGEREQPASPGDERYTGFSFDSAYEIAEGEWRFEIVYRGKVIGEQRFKVIVPLN
jgi:hypothetical protein